MSSRSLRLFSCAALMAGLSFAPLQSADVNSEQGQRVLRVAADPNNLPFSNDRLEGFENRIAEILADELDAKLEYTWHAQRRGFFRNTLKANKADLVLGVPAGFELARATRPYYHSTYVFLTRSDRNLEINSFDDPLLRTLKIGVQMVGDDGTNTPPAHALARRGIVSNVVGYTLYGDYSKPNPPARIVDAVTNGDIDVAVVWGPLAGYFAGLHSGQFKLTPVEQAVDITGLPMAYSISAGVRRGDDALYTSVQQAMDRRMPEILAILQEYRVPLIDPARVPQMPEEEDED